MSDWRFVIIGCLCVLGGIILTHSLFLYSKFHTDYDGYMWRAVRKIWGFLLLFLLIEWVVGCFFFLPISYLGSSMYPIVAAVIGCVVGFAPGAFELHLFAQGGGNVAKLLRPPTEKGFKLNLALRLPISWASEFCRQHGLY